MENAKKTNQALNDQALELKQQYDAEKAAKIGEHLAKKD